VGHLTHQYKGILSLPREEEEERKDGVIIRLPSSAHSPEHGAEFIPSALGGMGLPSTLGGREGNPSSSPEEEGFPLPHPFGEG